MPEDTPPVLSICIPTYNRADFIGETLESIASQALPAIEVVISDNASSDNTFEIVDSFRRRLPRLVYSRSETNQGFAANFFRAATLATGKYAWLLGSDDVIGPGMLQRAVNDVQTGATLYIYDRIECESNLTPLRLDPVLDARLRERLFPLGDRDALLRYFRHSRSIASLFSFISSVIYKKSEWDDVEVKAEWLECSFPHAIRMWGMARAGSTLEYVDQPLVLARLDNDTFNPDGKRSISRLLMNFHGYQMIRDEYWSDDGELCRAVNTVMRRTHSRLGMIKLRRIIADDEIEEVSRCLRDYGYGQVFSWLYRTDLCRLAVVALKTLFVRLGLSPDLGTT